MPDLPDPVVPAPRAFIDGDFVHGDGATDVVVDPATGERITDAPAAPPPMSIGRSAPRAAR